MVSVVDTYTSIALLRNGFTHHIQDNWLSYFPQHLLVHWSERSPTPRLSYWYRPHRSKTKHPFVFVHGIGVRIVARSSELHLTLPSFYVYRSAFGRIYLSY